MSDERDQAGGRTTSRASAIGASDDLGPSPWVLALGTRTARSRTPRAVRPFRHREYRLLVASGSASLLADGLWLVALVWQVIGTGGSPSDLSAVAAATSLGLVTAVLLGGVAADRFPKRAVLIGVEVVRTAVPVLAGVLALAGGLQLWQLATLAFILGIAVGFYYPAWSASVPLAPAHRRAAARERPGGHAAPARPTGPPARRSPVSWSPRSPLGTSRCSGPASDTWPPCCPCW